MKMCSAHGRRLVILVTAILLAAGLSAPSRTGRLAAAPSDHLVCLSPGHGGGDTGAVNGSLQEKELNWDIALLLKDKLVAAGYQVVLTHSSTAENPSGTERARLCNEQGADTVLWIHLNASSDPTVNYFQAFWGKRNKDLQFCQKLTDVFSLTWPNSSQPLEKKSVGQFASSVLLKSNAPACLLENVFLSNTEEATMFREQPGVREEQIAEQIYRGLLAWYSGG